MRMFSGMSSASMFVHAWPTPLRSTCTWHPHTRPVSSVASSVCSLWYWLIAVSCWCPVGSAVLLAPHLYIRCREHLVTGNPELFPRFTFSPCFPGLLVGNFYPARAREYCYRFHVRTLHQ